MVDERPALLTAKDLRERDAAWTEAAIRRFLGEPDQLKKNPFYRTAAPMRHYLQERVEKVEATDEWASWRTRSLKRSTAARQVAKRKEDDLLQEVSRVRISVSAPPGLGTVRKAAVNHFNERSAERALWRGDIEYEPATLDSDRQFLDRITVNYLRHECTTYDDVLDSLARRVGKRKAYDLIRGRVLDAVAERYPELRSECVRQKEPPGSW